MCALAGYLAIAQKLIEKASPGEQAALVNHADSDGDTVSNHSHWLATVIYSTLLYCTLTPAVVWLLLYCILLVK